jgi:hypothetical protein
MEQVGTSWKEQKRRKEVLDHNPVDWIGTSSRLHGDSGDWINCSEAYRNSRLQEFENPIDWMVIQAIELINPNLAESLGSILMKIQSTG